MKKMCILFFAIILLVSCNLDFQGKEDTPPETNPSSINYLGAYTSAPKSANTLDVYYNTSEGAAYVYLNNNWILIARDGLGINWLGEYNNPPSNPSRNDAYYNLQDGNSYIFNGSEWNYLARAGRDGSSGILKWVGSFASAPLNPSVGDAYHNETDGKSYIYSNDSWSLLSCDGVGITWLGSASHTPSNPVVNSAYYNTTDKKAYIWNGTAWSILSESIGEYYSIAFEWKGNLNSAPNNPSVGWIYYNTSVGSTYLWDGSVWRQIAKDGITPTGFLIQWKGTYASAPNNPQQGWAYYNSNNNKTYIYDGSSWRIMLEGSSSSSKNTFENVIIKVNGNDFYDYSTIKRVDLNPMYYGQDSSQVIEISLTNTGSTIADVSAFRISSDSSEISYDWSHFTDTLNEGQSCKLICTYTPKYAATYDLNILSFYTSTSGIENYYYIYTSYFAPSFNLTFSNGSKTAYGGIGSSSYKNTSINLGKVPNGRTITVGIRPEGTQYGAAEILTASLSGDNASDFSVNLYQADRNYDSINLYKVDLTLNASEAGNKKTNLIITTNLSGNETISIPISLSAYNMTSVFDNEGYFYYDSGEGDGNDVPYVLLRDVSDNIYIIGKAFEKVSDHSGKDTVIIKLDANGYFQNEWIIDDYVDLSYYQNGRIDDNQIRLNYEYDYYYDFSDDWNSNSTDYVVIDLDNKTVTKHSEEKLSSDYNEVASKIQSNKFNISGVDFDFGSGYELNSFYSTNDFIIVGLTKENYLSSFSDQDSIIRVYQKTGALVWEKSFNGERNDSDWPVRVFISNGKVYVFGMSYDMLSSFSGLDSYIHVYSLLDGTPLASEWKTFDSPLNWFDMVGNTMNAVAGNTWIQFNIDMGIISETKIHYYQSSSYKDYNDLLPTSSFVYQCYYGSNKINGHSNYDWEVIRTKQ